MTGLTIFGEQPKYTGPGQVASSGSALGLYPSAPSYQQAPASDTKTIDPRVNWTRLWFSSPGIIDVSIAIAPLPAPGAYPLIERAIARLSECLAKLRDEGCEDFR